MIWQQIATRGQRTTLMVAEQPLGEAKKGRATVRGAREVEDG